MEQWLTSKNIFLKKIEKVLLYSFETVAMLTQLTEVDDELKLLNQYIATMWPMHKKQLSECVIHYWNIKDEFFCF